MPSTLLRRLLGILGAMALSSGALGCSFSITPEAVEPPPTKISTVAIGSIEAADPDRQRIVRRFRRALAAGLEDSEAFSRVLSTAPAQLPADAVLVTGRFLEVKDGSEALRFLVGYGVGSPTLRALRDQRPGRASPRVVRRRRPVLRRNRLRGALEPGRHG